MASYWADLRVLLMDPRSLLGTGLVCGALAAMAWWVFARPDGNRTTTFSHMHCSECKEEAAHQQKLAGKICLLCDKGRYVPTVGSITEGGKADSEFSTGMVFAIAAFVVLEGLAYYLVLRLCTLRVETKRLKQIPLICACPFCQRRIGYLAERAGTVNVCSRCKTAFALPSPGADAWATAQP